VHLHPGEARVDGAAGGGGEVGDGLPDVVGCHLARGDGFLESGRGVDGLGQRYRRGGDRGEAAVVGVADASAVLDLEEHRSAAGGLDGLGDLAPSGGVGVGVQGGDVRIGLADCVRVDASAMIAPAVARWV
jgi:hypothetical protein